MTWTSLVSLVAAGLVLYWRHMTGAPPMWALIGLIACAGTVALILMADIPLYIRRWRAGKRDGLRYLRVVRA
jgi:hypothetical protein